MLLHLGNSPTVVVSSMEIAKELVKTNDIVFASRPQMNTAHDLCYGGNDVAFSRYCEYWRQAKKICVVELLSLKRVKSFQFLRDEEVKILVEEISSSCKNGDSVNLGEMLLTLSFNIISGAVIGRKIKGKDGDKSFAKFARRAMELIGAFCMKDYFPSLGWMDVLTGLVAKLKETSQGLDTLIK
ncbi:p450 domain-containing protein [Cephalotus follicularis]|uniref:p450 domain-containing protein n=1 Tax=Cephalotus follicularis TaxID=3775 RepID=A0A1Q3DIZ3_CEPFO|nr:p450 domain-containing protein [Cephalotus follicularis]